MVKVTVLLTHLQYKAIAHAAMTMLWAVVGIFWALICLANSTGVSCYMMFLWELWQPTADCLKSSPPCDMSLCQLESCWVQTPQDSASSFWAFLLELPPICILALFQAGRKS